MLLGLDDLGQPGVVCLEGREEHLVGPGAAGGKAVKQGPDSVPPRPFGHDPLLGLVIHDLILDKIVYDVEDIEVLDNLLPAISEIIAVREIHVYFLFNPSVCIIFSFW